MTFETDSKNSSFVLVMGLLKIMVRVPDTRLTSKLLIKTPLLAPFLKC